MGENSKKNKWVMSVSTSLKNVPQSLQAQ